LSPLNQPKADKMGLKLAKISYHLLTMNLSSDNHIGQQPEARASSWVGWHVLRELNAHMKHMK